MAPGLDAICIRITEVILIARALQMIRIVILGLLFVPAFAGAQQSQQAAIERGAVVFAGSCTGYCHGANGSAGSGAPAVAGRGLDADYIAKVVTFGIPGTVMAGWGQRIPNPDLAAVIAYVESVNGLLQPTNAVHLGDLTLEAQHGSSLFYDSDGCLSGCSNCHQMNGKGIPVAAPISNIPADAAALRELTTPRVSTATVGGRRFPALVVTQVRGETKLYDLTMVPPVLLTLSPAEVKLANGSPWRHSVTLGSLADKDLEPILEFLRALQRP